MLVLQFAKAYGTTKIIQSTSTILLTNLAQMKSMTPAVALFMLATPNYKAQHPAILEQYWNDFTGNIDNKNAFMNALMSYNAFKIDCNIWSPSHLNIFNVSKDAAAFALLRTNSDVDFNACKSAVRHLFSIYTNKIGNTIDRHFLFQILKKVALTHEIFKFSVDYAMVPIMKYLRSELSLEFICKNIEFSAIEEPLLFRNIDNIYRFKYFRKHWMETCVDVNYNNMEIKTEESNHLLIQMGQFIEIKYAQWMEEPLHSVLKRCLASTKLQSFHPFNCLSVVLMEPQFILKPRFNNNPNGLKQAIDDATSKNDVKRLFWLAAMDVEMKNKLKQ